MSELGLENQIKDLYASGYKPKEIAHRLKIDPAKVRYVFKKNKFRVQRSKEELKALIEQILANQKAGMNTYKNAKATGLSYAYVKDILKRYQGK